MGEGGRILIVDDDAGTRETLGDVLERAGHVVRKVTEGLAALNSLTSAAAEAAIIDLRLPDISGLDLLEAIKLSSPETEVIIITGHASMPSALQAINGAAFGYLTKPFETPHLIAMLDRALEKHRLARALRESEEQYRLVTEHISDAIFFLDLDGRLIFGNPRCTKLTGYGADEFQRTWIFSLLTPEGAVEAQARFDAARAGRGMSPPFETPLIRKDGSLVRVEADFTGVLKDGRVIGLLGVARDISERQRADQALREANQALTALVTHLEQRNREMALLSEMGDLLQRCHTSAEAHGVIAQFGRRLFPADSGMLAVLNASNTLVEVVTHWGKPLPGEQVFAPEQCWALRRGRAHVVEAPDSGPSCEHLDYPLPARYVCLPLMAQGAPIGILHLQGGADGVDEHEGSSERMRQFRQRLAIGTRRDQTAPGPGPGPVPGAGQPVAGRRDLSRSWPDLGGRAQDCRLRPLPRQAGGP